MRAVTCDILSVGRLVLAVVRQQAPASGSLTSSHMFWYGILLALGCMDPPRADGGSTVRHCLARDGAASLDWWPRSFRRVPYVIVAVIAVLAGPYFGRIRGLRQLGNPTSEYAFMMPGESAAGCSPGHLSARWKER